MSKNNVEPYVKAWQEVNQQVSVEAVQAEDEVQLDAVQPLQHFTKPRGHFTEATTVKALEEYGIGRPSTYASMLKLLQASPRTLRVPLLLKSC